MVQMCSFHWSKKHITIERSKMKRMQKNNNRWIPISGGCGQYWRYQITYWTIVCERGAFYAINFEHSCMTLTLKLWAIGPTCVAYIAEVRLTTRTESFTHVILPHAYAHRSRTIDGFDKNMLHLSATNVMRNAYTFLSTQCVGMIACHIHIYTTSIVCKASKLIWTSNGLLKLLRSTTDWHSIAFVWYTPGHVVYTMYCHETKFGKFWKWFSVLFALWQKSHLLVVFNVLYKFCCYLNVYCIHGSFVRSFVRTFICSFVCIFFHCQFVIEMSVWALAPFIIILCISYLSSILNNNRIRNFRFYCDVAIFVRCSAFEYVTCLSI